MPPACPGRGFTFFATACSSAGQLFQQAQIPGGHVVSVEVAGDISATGAAQLGGPRAIVGELLQASSGPSPSSRRSSTGSPCRTVRSRAGGSGRPRTRPGGRAPAPSAAGPGSAPGRPPAPPGPGRSASFAGPRRRRSQTRCSPELKVLPVLGLGVFVGVEPDTSEQRTEFKPRHPG